MERLSGSLPFGLLTQETDASDYSFFSKLEMEHHLRQLPPQVEALYKKELLGQ
jgi:hypothetical protein